MKNYVFNPFTTALSSNMLLLIYYAFYPNVTTLRSGICYLTIVCRLSSITFLHLTQPVEISAMFLRYFVPQPFADLHAKLHGNRPQEPLRRVLSVRGVAEYSDV